MRILNQGWFKPCHLIVISMLVFATCRVEADTLSFNHSTGLVTPIHFSGGSSGHDGRLESDTYFVGYDYRYIPKFDPSIGTLQNIQLTLAMYLTNSASFSYSGPPQAPPPSGGGNHGLFFSSFKVYDRYGFLYLAGNSPTIGGGVGSSSQEVPPGSTVSDTLGIWGSYAGAITDPALLANFTGANDGIELQFEIKAFESLIGYYADPSSGNGISQMDYSVIYDFTPVPEPSRFALILLGGSILIGTRYRSLHKGKASR